MNLLADPAQPTRVSGTNAASVAQAAVVLAGLVLGIVNEKAGLGWDEKLIGLAAVSLVVLLQAAANWYQRRATAKVQNMIQSRTLR